MGYSSSKNKPFEWASKAQHTHIINDTLVQDLLKRCKLPSTQADAAADIKNALIPLLSTNETSIKTIVAIDGGYASTTVKKSFPSSEISFFQFGALIFNVYDLNALDDKPFIHPEDMEKFRQLGRYKLALPSKGISLDGKDIIDTVRYSIIEFFNHTDLNLIKTLKWFLFHDYDTNPLNTISFGTLPNQERLTKQFPIKIAKNELDEYGFFMVDDHQFNLIDIFRLHEAIDIEQGAGGILGYLTNLIEHILIIHFIRELYISKPQKISSFLFIKDGPLGFFGQTANLHKDMRNLCSFFIKNYNLKLVGLEKSGAFVEHAGEISKGDDAPLEKGNIFLLSNNYIYKHILPGPSNIEQLNKLPIYAHTSYYSGKLIFRSSSGRVWVITIPIHDSEIIRAPEQKHYPNLHTILNCLEKLKCDMYDNAIVPIALVNRLVSLANHPSSKILEKFASQSIDN